MKSKLALGLLALLTVACRDQLRPNMCERSSDCPVGLRCQVDGGPDFLRCVPIAVERDTSTAGDVTDAAAAETVPPGADSAAEVAPDSAPSDTRDARPPECVEHAQCMDPARPLCANQVCVACATGGGSASCLASDPARPFCAASGRCSECGSNEHCRTPGRPICAMDACLSCVALGATVCTGATPVCNPTSGACAACLGDGDCKSGTAPFCVANACVGCSAVSADRCAARAPGTPACGPAGACVECNSSADCGFDPQRPICNPATHTCRACAQDSECALRADGPGVCLDHSGRCATDAESIYVDESPSCTPNLGTRAVPLCAPSEALALVTSTRNVIVLRGPLAGASWTVPTGTPPLTVVGQSAILAGGSRSGLRLDGPSDVLVRGIIVTGSLQPGIVATGRVGLTLRDSAVLDNPGGGILIDSARFTLGNVLVAGNGVGQTGATSWGGLLVLGDLTPRSLDRVSIKDNKLLGVACFPNAISATNTYVASNGPPGSGAESQAQPTCALAPCPTESATCGTTVTPPP